MKSSRWLFSYIGAAALGLGLAFTVSIQFFPVAHSQTPPLENPSAGDLPPEFLNEIENTPPAPPQQASPQMGESEAVSTQQPAETTLEGGSVSVNNGYVYDPTGRRDPFVPFRSMIQVMGERKTEPVESLDPLRKWDIERFKVIGILWEIKNPKAMLRDPDGVIHTVTKNTKVGRNDGYITAIREGEVVVVQSFEYDGKINKETKILELGK